MVSQASSTAMAMTVLKITRRQGGVHGEGVSYTTDQPQATTVRESGLRPGSLPLRHFCFTAIDRTPLPSNFSTLLPLLPCPLSRYQVSQSPARCQRAVRTLKTETSRIL